jgi:hypothetical protein
MESIDCLICVNASQRVSAIDRLRRTALLRLVKSVALFYLHLEEEEVGAAKQRHVPVEVMREVVADLISEGIPH